MIERSRRVNQEQPDLAIFQEAVPHWHNRLKPLQSNYPYHICAAKLEIEIHSKLPLPQPEIKLYGVESRGAIMLRPSLLDLDVRVSQHPAPEYLWSFRPLLMWA